MHQPGAGLPLMCVNLLVFSRAGGRAARTRQMYCSGGRWGLRGGSVAEIGGRPEARTAWSRALDGVSNGLRMSGSSIDGKSDGRSTSGPSIDGKPDSFSPSGSSIDGQSDSLSTSGSSIDGKSDSLRGWSDAVDRVFEAIRSFSINEVPFWHSATTAAFPAYENPAIRRG